MWVEGWGELPGQLVVVSGPSGSGKSTLVRALLRRPDLDLRLSVSATTRDPRPGERDGHDYFFLTAEAFAESQRRGELLEWAEYNRRLYGTPARPVFEALAEGRSVLLEIEVRGALQVRDRAPGALFVFVRTPTFRDLEARLRGRGTETDAALHDRLRKAREELAEAHWYDHRLVNDDLPRCADEFAAILKSHVPGG